ncbi:MAG TPA: 7TM diverse intracellular signaling domain-containing protein, partial [Chryseosolibacter sp.]|nr:7TM diverse intracellular signaling domain-containing protein [Chryseosolibacter sp.]
LYIFTAAYPDFPWETAVKIEYVTLYLTMAFAVLFISSVFPEDTSNIFKYLFVVCNITFTLFTIITEASTYTQFLPVYMAIAAILLVYILYVLIRATVYERPAVWFIVGCLALGVIFFAYDLVAYEGFIRYNSVITHIAYFLMFILLATSLFVRYGFIRRTAGRRDILTYDDLYGSRK